MKTYTQQQCENLCKAIAKLRAHGRCELLCGNEATDGHHLFFGKWRHYWQLCTNHNYYVGLCNPCHEHAKFAPHVNNHDFWTLLEEKMILTGALERLHVIKHQKRLLENGIFPADIKPQWKVLHQFLKEEYKRMKQTSWMDTYACQVPPGRKI